MEKPPNEISEGEVSDDGLKLVIDDPKKKLTKRVKTITMLNPEEKQIIESIEQELEETLAAKAAKSNLNVTHVRTLLKQVVTNEHVVALVRQGENPDIPMEPLFEPKLTRAKAKQLFSSTTTSSIPWLTPNKPPSEVQQLISDELAEDSSGDEYVPAEEESEDDRDSSALSETELRSISPPTPVKPNELSEVHWTDDGVFKIPPTKTVQEEEEAANIALRTRSKLSLSSTPLEVIEEAFIPPDITTDMYDMHCDDDDWRDFLKKFTRPLDEITKATEDEDHDPEYNILADEDIEEVDTEELREDKAVKVSRKELNELMSELFEYANAFSTTQDDNSSKIDVIQESQVTILENVSITNNESNSQNTNIVDSTDCNLSLIQPANEFILDDVMRVDQKLLLDQQMRQHIQMLLQNFLLTYQHPEYHSLALQFKESLINFKLLALDKEHSVFKPCNLDGSLKLVENWENKFSLNTDEVKTTKEFVCRVVQETKEMHLAGIFYVPNFPPMLMETITKSDVFLYPNLLPRIPFKPAEFNHFVPMTRSENQLIALGLEQFMPYLAKDSYHLTYKGEVKLQHVCSLLHQYMIPVRSINKLYSHISNYKKPMHEMNPIKYYFENKRAPATMHYVVNLDVFKVLPPDKRPKELLPHQWKEYLYPETLETSVATASPTSTSNVSNKIIKPPPFNKNFTNKCFTKKRLLKSNLSTPTRRNTQQRNATIFSSTPKNSNSLERVPKLERYFKSPRIESPLKNSVQCLQCMKFNSSIFKKLRTSKNLEGSDTMLPSMPFLGAMKNIELDKTNSVSSTSNRDNSIETNRPVEADSTIVDGEYEETVEKDNPDDINALMIASSTIKNLGRRGPSGSEKKKTKLRREYSAALAMLSPEDPTVIQEKAQSFAQAYFDKAQEKLNPQDYQQFMDILNNFDNKSKSVSDLYKQIQELLCKKHADLLDEFLTFLTPAQAKDIGKLVPYYMLSNMSLFLRKLEIYFKEQPAQLRKIYRSLTELATCMHVTMDRVKNTILPLLKGNSLLTDWFLQIFPREPPPESLLRGAWEHVEVRREINGSEDLFELVTIPEVDDPFGGPNCSCSCHQQDDLLYKSRSQHCTPCGIKFVQGRIYVQTGKGLRLANVTFSGNPTSEHLQRLSCPSSTDKKKKRSETSPSKQITSPTKDTQEEIRAANDSEDEIIECSRKRARVSRSPRKKRMKLGGKPLPNKSKLEEQNENSDQNLNVASCSGYKTIVEESSNKSPEERETNQNKSMGDEPNEWDCNTSIESIELRFSPEQSADSGSEFCEESSQDNINTETDDSAEEIESLSNSPVHSENSNSNTFEEMSWTRDEDKIILETMQKEGDKEEAFVQISNVLSNRSIVSIKERFDTLMNLLQKMASSSNAEF